MSGFYNFYNVTEKCRECKGTDIFTDRTAGEVICRECGVVLGERLIDDGAEWRTFNHDDALYGSRADPNRAGGAVSALFSSESVMNTFIEGGKDARETARLQKAQGKAVKESATESALKDCFARVREFGNNLGLPSSVQEDACLLLRQVTDKGLFHQKKGVRGDAMCAAVIYLTCRQQGVSRTLTEVAPAASVTKKDISKSFKHLERNMKLDRGTVRGEHLVPRLCGILGVRGVITIAAKHVAKMASDLDIVGGMIPQGVAAAAILLVCLCCPDRWREADETSKGGEKRDDDEAPGATTVVQAAGCSENAIRRPFRAMHDVRERLLTEELLRGIKLKGVKVADLPCAL